MFISRIYSDANPPARDEESRPSVDRGGASTRRPNCPALGGCHIHVSPDFGLLTERESAIPVVDRPRRAARPGNSQGQCNAPPAVPNSRYVRAPASLWRSLWRNTLRYGSRSIALEDHMTRRAFAA